MNEPLIHISGVLLTDAQAMTIRIAIQCFAETLQDGLGEDEHGKIMTASYLNSIFTINALMSAK